MSKLSTRPAFSGTEIQDTDEFWINVDNLDTTFTSKKITGLQLMDLIKSTPFYEENTSNDIGNDKSLNIYRNGTIAGNSFNSKKYLTSTGVSDNNKWWKVFSYSTNGVNDGESLTILMNEFSRGFAIGKVVNFEVIISRGSVSDIHVSVNINSKISSFNLSNFAIQHDLANERLLFYYRLDNIQSTTNWVVFNSRSGLQWNNTLIGTSLSGEPNDTITTKTISLNKINGVYTLPSTTPTTGQVIGNNEWLQLDTTATTGSVISFAIPQVYNTFSSPSSSNITDDLTGAKIGIVQKIYSNKTVAPTFPAGWVLMGTGTYTTSTLNVIFAEWVSSTRVEYWITKPA